MITYFKVNDLGGIKWIRAYPVQSGVDSFKPSTQADIKWNRGEGKAQIVYQPSPEDQSAFSQDGKNPSFLIGPTRGPMRT